MDVFPQSHTHAALVFGLKTFMLSDRIQQFTCLGSRAESQSDEEEVKTAKSMWQRRRDEEYKGRFKATQEKSDHEHNICSWCLNIFQLHWKTENHHWGCLLLRSVHVRWTLLYFTELVLQEAYLTLRFSFYVPLTSCWKISRSERVHMQGRRIMTNSSF